MADSLDYPNCKYENFIDSDGKPKQSNGVDRIDLFLDKFYGDQQFLTEVGLLDVFWCIIKVKTDEYEFDAGFKNERDKLKSTWLATAGLGNSKSIKFGVGIKGVVKEKTITLTKFKKTEDIVPGAAPGQKKVNKGTQFEEHFYEDALKVLESKKGNRFIPFIKNFNMMMTKKLKEGIVNIEVTGSKGQDSKFSGVLEEGSKNQSRPLKQANGNGLIVAGGASNGNGNNIGSVLTDITFQYGEDKKPVYLSLKYGPTLTFFNSGVRGKNGPKLFTPEEIKKGVITTAGGLAFLKMFGIDDNQNMLKFCNSFREYPRKKPIPGHKVKVTPNKDAIKKLLKSGIGYGYWMIHNTRGTTIDSYEITETYMNKASNITGDVTVYFGRMNGKGKGVNITCSSAYYNFIFNVRNKQGKLYPSHVMCDYKKTGGTPSERPEIGGADYEC